MSKIVIQFPSMEVIEVEDNKADERVTTVAHNCTFISEAIANGYADSTIYLNGLMFEPGKSPVSSIIQISSDTINTVQFKNREIVAVTKEGIIKMLKENINMVTDSTYKANLQKLLNTYS